MRQTNKMAVETDEAEFMSKEEALWTKVKEASESRLKQHEEAAIIEKAMIELAKAKIKETAY